MPGYGIRLSPLLDKSRRLHLSPPKASLDGVTDLDAQTRTDIRAASADFTLLSPLTPYVMYISSPRHKQSDLSSSCIPFLNGLAVRMIQEHRFQSPPCTVQPCPH